MNELMNIQIPLWAVAAYMVFMCAVQTLPRPLEGANPFYVWVYGFLHLLCLNLALVLDPTKKLKQEANAPTTTATVAQTTSAAPVPPKPDP